MEVASLLPALPAPLLVAGIVWLWTRLQKVEAQVEKTKAHADMWEAAWHALFAKSIELSIRFEAEQGTLDNKNFKPDLGVAPKEKTE